MTTMRVPVERARRCLGVRVSDGTIYGADRTGRIDVENPRHAAEILRDEGIAGDIVEVQALARGTKGRTCPECAFSAFAFSNPCPRCGADLKGVHPS